MCVNFAPLNAQCEDVTWPLPDCASLVEALHGGKWFTSLDLKSGYSNVRIAEEDVGHTTFVTQDGAYRCPRLMFGLKGGPGFFQHCIWAIVVLDHDGSVVVYLDDIVVRGATREETWARTLQVVGRLRDAGFLINLGKSVFLAQAVEVVGYKVA